MFLVAGVLILACAITGLAPATLVADRVARESDGIVRIAEASGSAWRGQGTLTDRHGNVRIPVAWTLAPLPLSRGVADITLTPAGSGATPRGRIELAEDRVRVQDVEIALPVDAIVSAGAAPWHAGGELSLRSPGLTLARNGSDGTLFAEWRNARLVVPGGAVADFGVISARLGVRGNALAGPIEARGGQVSASGDLALSASGANLDVELVPSPSAPAGIRHALAQLGPTDARGAVRLVREFR